MLDFLKNIISKKTDKIPMTIIKVKANKENFNYYKGKFVSIEVENNIENYYFTIYDRKKKQYIKITNKVDKKYFNLCSQYDYGLIYDYDGQYYSIAIICQKGYLKVYDIDLTQKYNNGSSFIIKDNNLIDDNNLVGKIKRNSNEIISMNCLEDNKLICFIKK